MTNVFRVDATTLDNEGTVIPRDLEDAPDAYDLSRSVKSDWAIKVVNVGGDADVDVQPLVSTSDDSTFEEYAEDGDPETASSGDVPDNVAYVTGETVAGHLGALVSAPEALTAGEIKIVFNSRLYGGA